MKILVLTTGATNEKYIQHGIDHYLKRLSNYKPQVEYRELTIPSKIYRYKDVANIVQAEFEFQLKQLEPSDFLSILDSRGEVYTSEDFAAKMQHMINNSYKRWVLLIGGPFGFAPELLDRAHEKISLSSMTFTHQMVRLVLLEQLYRAQSIIHNQSYHH
nr:23S rRNA (pseudouridine(1915)-N(3))-methyltransferase RlmH [Saprospiraceae bacterium]